MNTTLIIILAIVAIILLLVFVVRNKMKTLSDVKSSESILVLSDKHFTQQTKGKTILVDFWADWCMPCKMMLPILNDLSAELPEGYFVGKIDVDKNQVVAQKFGVKNIPTLILFKDGKEISRFVGVKRKSFLKNQMLK